ncbi:ABC transporter permease [Salibacter halophilus]|uniref:ABC transporter permease n=1 Tax=Salibacter halophilus TaxID=1803916 RepID=A0A6N6M5Z9_9FLAO|nr:FtsX-like permease family protein [Salibacter halophilus]KAB1062722.1 ABC transporter permease [Salibacter halophilus]
MKFERFIAAKMIGERKSASSNTRPIIKIAIGGIAVGVAVMILSFAILTGFQSEIRQKVVGFGSHIQISSFDNAQGVDIHPISKNQDFYPAADSFRQVENIQVYATKPGILKTDDEILGIVFKGVGEDFNWKFFERNIEKGKIPRFGQNRKDSILVSQHIADKMKLDVGDKIYVYFIRNEKPRPRRFFVSGIYKTGMGKFDELILLGDIKHVQSINGWDSTQVGGFEINLKDYESLQQTNDEVYNAIPYSLNATNIQEKYPDIFGWLELQDMNVVIIVILIILVSSINMTSALLIMILERTGMIGILKAMGSRNWSIRKIFLYNAMYLISVGVFWGNLIGIGIALLQEKLRFITLPEETYYISYVPINLDISHILLLNFGTVALCTIMLIIPSMVITRISPVRAIKFD